MTKTEMIFLSMQLFFPHELEDKSMRCTMLSDGQVGPHAAVHTIEINLHDIDREEAFILKPGGNHLRKRKAKPKQFTRNNW